MLPMTPNCEFLLLSRPTMVFSICVTDCHPRRRYARGQDYLERSDIIGSVVAYVPFVGYVTILLSEYPWLKTVMLGIMGLMVVLQRE